MSISVVERLSNYVKTEPHVDICNETPPILEPQSQEVPALADSWRNTKHSFVRLGERIRQSRNELKVIGRLAVLDIEGAAAIEVLQSSEPEPAVYQQLPFRQRVWDQVERIETRKKYERRRKIREIKNRAGWSVATLGAGALAGFVSVKLTELMS